MRQFKRIHPVLGQKRDTRSPKFFLPFLANTCFEKGGCSLCREIGVIGGDSAGEVFVLNPPRAERKGWGERYDEEEGGGGGGRRGKIILFPRELTPSR